MNDIERRLSMEDPPDEMYERVHLEAVKLLEDAGPRAAFFLVVVSDAGEEGYATVAATSTGADHIPALKIVQLIGEWVRELYAR